MTMLRSIKSMETITMKNNAQQIMANSDSLYNKNYHSFDDSIEDNPSLKSLLGATKLAIQQQAVRVAANKQNNDTSKASSSSSISADELKRLIISTEKLEELMQEQSGSNNNKNENSTEVRTKVEEASRKLPLRSKSSSYATTTTARITTTTADDGTFQKFLDQRKASKSSEANKDLGRGSGHGKPQRIVRPLITRPKLQQRPGMFKSKSCRFDRPKPDINSFSLKQKQKSDNKKSGTEATATEQRRKRILKQQIEMMHVDSLDTSVAAFKERYDSDLNLLDDHDENKDKDKKKKSSSSSSTGKIAKSLAKSLKGLPDKKKNNIKDALSNSNKNSSKSSSRPRPGFQRAKSLGNLTRSQISKSNKTEKCNNVEEQPKKEAYTVDTDKLMNVRKGADIMDERIMPNNSRRRMMKKSNSFKIDRSSSCYCYYYTHGDKSKAPASGGGSGDSGAVSGFIKY